MIKEFQERIGSAAWNLDFFQFCQRAGFDPKHDHAKEKWTAFRALSSNLSKFDAATLEKIITEPAPPVVTEDAHLESQYEARTEIFE
jgi:hypothetical protein